MGRAARATAWTGFRSVLCPIDFSEQSRLALRYAEAIAVRGGGTLTVIYVSDPLLVSAAAVALHDQHLGRRSANELQAFVEATIAPASKRRLRMKPRVATGDPSDEILKTAARAQSDLVILGTHGLTGAERLLMGSTTLSLLQRTKVPVLAVPLRGQNPGPAFMASWPSERVVAALELDRASRVEVDTAARLAQWFGSSLLLLHVVSEITAPEWVRADVSPHDRIRVALAQRQLDELATDSRRRVKTEGRVVCGRVGDEIAALAAAERTALIITALRDRRGWFGARRGSVSYHVLSHAVAPVLAYPSSWHPH